MSSENNDDDVICKNYVEGECPCRCIFNDCHQFKPTSYMLHFIAEFYKK